MTLRTLVLLRILEFYNIQKIKVSISQFLIAWNFIPTQKNLSTYK